MTEKKDPFSVRIVTWNTPDADKLKTIRFKVFVDEQKVAAELELDEIDETAIHAVAENEKGEACGTGRMFLDSTDAKAAKIGRMAVLEKFRGHGCGSAILSFFIREAGRLGYKEIKLSAQVHAVSFYEQFGFRIRGSVFDDAGIPHHQMFLTVKNS